VGDAVDHRAAGAADPFPAIVVEGHRLLAGQAQPFVQDVEHFQEGDVGGDRPRLIALESAGIVGPGLAPDPQAQVDGLLLNRHRVKPSKERDILEWH
jgi:hypothetical protein